MPPKEKTDQAATGTAASAAVPPAGDGSPDLAQAATRRAAAQPGNAGMVQALLAERRGYVQRGLPARVAQVDEQILFHGGTPPADER